MDLDIPLVQQKYLEHKLSDLSFNESRIKDVENSKIFSFKESGEESGGVAGDVKKIQAFCRKFGYSVLAVSEISESGHRALVQISKRSSMRVSFIYGLVLILVIVAALNFGWFTSVLFWIIAISFVAVIFMFIGTRWLSKYFRDKKLEPSEEQSQAAFMLASEDRRLEILNAINDQLFSTHGNRFGILTTIAAVAAAMLIVASFQGDMTLPLKTFASILMVAVSISLWAYAAKMEQLIKRAERLYMNVYTPVPRKPQYNPLRFSNTSRSFAEKIFSVIDELPVVLSMVVAISILDIIVLIWFFPCLI